MNIYRLLRSNRSLQAVGACMGVFGLLDGFIQIRHGSATFAAFTCVLAVYYLHHGRSAEPISLQISLFDSRFLKRLTLLSFGLSLIAFSIIEIGTSVEWLSRVSFLAYAIGVMFFATFMASWMCASIIVFRYLKNKLSRW